MKPYIASTSEPLLPLDLWMSGTELLRGLSPAAQAWLTETGLLGDRIRAAAGTPATLTVIEERLAFLTAEQQALLEAPAASCFQREVEIGARGRPLVYAQSLVPDHTLELHPWLAELGDSSLAATLAGLPGLARGPFEFAPLPSVHPLAARALARLEASPAIVWARRSWFELGRRRLLVQEVFLPGLEQW